MTDDGHQVMAKVHIAFGKVLSFDSLGKSYLSFNRGEDFFLKINQSETRIACGDHV
jgi:hypothetical protein